MLHLLLAVTLAWTFPAKQLSGAPINGPKSWTVYRLAPQSPTWIAHLGGKLALADSAGADSLWRRWWPSVRAECAPVAVASGVWTYPQVGQPFTLTLADTSLHGTFVVMCKNDAGECGYFSNMVTK